jgi:hypothetical protein
MARYEFRFIVTDTELSDEHRQRVGRAVAEAGALALSGLTPPKALTVQLDYEHWWCGIPPAEILGPLEDFAAQAAEGGFGATLQ